MNKGLLLPIQYTMSRFARVGARLLIGSLSMTTKATPAKTTRVCLGSAPVTLEGVAD